MMFRIQLRRKPFYLQYGSVDLPVTQELATTHTPESKTYTDLVDLLKNHFNPTPSVIMHRFKFNTRTRKDTESVATFR